MNDTESNEPVMQLTPEAVEEVRSLQQKPENAGKTLRVYVEKGGCSGMQYGLVFDEQRDGDLQAERDGVVVLVDTFSAQYVRGATVEFSDSLNSGGFKIKNPNARENCGCGSSFNT